MQPEVTEKLISIEKLADYLGGVGRSTIYRHINTLPGFPQPVKIGAATRFRRSDVERYIAGLEINGGSA